MSSNIEHLSHDNTVVTPLPFARAPHRTIMRRCLLRLRLEKRGVAVTLTPTGALGSASNAPPSVGTKLSKLVMESMRDKKSPISLASAQKLLSNPVPALLWSGYSANPQDAMVRPAEGVPSRTYWEHQLQEAGLLMHNASKVEGLTTMPRIAEALVWFEAHLSQIASYGSLHLICNFGRSTLQLRDGWTEGLSFVAAHILPVVASAARSHHIHLETQDTSKQDQLSWKNLMGPFLLLRQVVDAVYTASKCTTVESDALERVMTKIPSLVGHVASIFDDACSVVSKSSAAAKRLDAFSWITILTTFERVERMMRLANSVIMRVAPGSTHNGGGSSVQTLFADIVSDYRSKKHFERIAPHLNGYLDGVVGSNGNRFTAAQPNHNGGSEDPLILRPRAVASILTFLVRLNAEANLPTAYAASCVVQVMQESVRRCNGINDLNGFISSLARLKASRLGRQISNGSLDIILSRCRGPFAECGPHIHPVGAAMTMQSLAKLRVSIPASILSIMCERFLTLRDTARFHNRHPTPVTQSVDAGIPSDEAADGVEGRPNDITNDIQTVVHFVSALGRCLQQSASSNTVEWPMPERESFLETLGMDTLQVALQIVTAHLHSGHAMPLPDCAQLIEGFTTISQLQSSTSSKSSSGRGAALIPTGGGCRGATIGGLVIRLIRLLEPTLRSALESTLKTRDDGSAASPYLHHILAIVASLAVAQNCTTLTFEEDQLMASIEQLRRDLLKAAPMLIPSGPSTSHHISGDVAQLLSATIDSLLLTQQEQQNSHKTTTVDDDGLLLRLKPSHRSISHSDSDADLLDSPETEVATNPGADVPSGAESGRQRLAALLRRIPKYVDPNEGGCGGAQISAFAKSLSRALRTDLMEISDVTSELTSVIEAAVDGFIDASLLVSKDPLAMTLRVHDLLEPFAESATFQSADPLRTSFFNGVSGTLQLHEFCSLAPLMMVYGAADGGTTAVSQAERMTRVWLVTMSRIVVASHRLQDRELRWVLHLLTKLTVPWLRNAVGAAVGSESNVALMTSSCNAIFDAATKAVFQRLLVNVTVEGTTPLHECSGLVASLNAIRVKRGEGLALSKRDSDTAVEKAESDIAENSNLEMQGGGDDEADDTTTAADEVEEEVKGPDMDRDHAWRESWLLVMKKLGARCCGQLAVTATDSPASMLSTQDVRWMLKIIKGFRDAAFDDTSLLSSDEELPLLYALMPHLRSVATQLSPVELSIALHCYAGAGAWNVRWMQPLLDVACDGIPAAPVRPCVALLLSLIKSQFLRREAVLHTNASSSRTAVNSARQKPTRTVGADVSMERLATQLCHRVAASLPSRATDSTRTSAQVYTWRERDLCTLLNALGWFDFPPQPLFDEVTLALLEHVVAPAGELQVASLVTLLKLAHKMQDATATASLFGRVMHVLCQPRGVAGLASMFVKHYHLCVSTVTRTACVAPIDAAAALLSAFAAATETNLAHFHASGRIEAAQKLNELKTVLGLHCSAAAVDASEWIMAVTKCDGIVKGVSDDLTPNASQQDNVSTLCLCCWLRLTLLQFDSIDLVSLQKMLDQAASAMDSRGRRGDVMQLARCCASQQDRITLVFVISIVYGLPTVLAQFYALLPSASMELVAWMLRIAARAASAPRDSPLDLNGVITALERVVVERMRADERDIRDWAVSLVILLKDPPCYALLKFRQSPIVKRLPILVQKLTGKRRRLQVSIVPQVEACFLSASSNVE